MVILVLQSRISYGLTFGRLAPFITDMNATTFRAIWFWLRALSIIIVLILWLMNHTNGIERAIIIANALFTLGLLMSTLTIVDVLTGFTTDVITIILADVVLLATSNVLIFSIWYWLMDPPGIAAVSRQEEAWDFLFPQRAADELPFYEAWVPSYTDYLYLAFSATLAFSPSVTLPLSKRAKWIMIFQTSISVVTLVVIAGTAISALSSI